MLINILLGTLHVAIDKHLEETCLDHGRNQAAVVTSHRLPLARKTCGSAHLDTLGVHFVVFIGLCPIQSSVTLLADEEVGEVHLFEFQFDGLLELGGHQFSCLCTCECQHMHKRTHSPSLMAIGRSGQPNLTITESVSP